MTDLDSRITPDRELNDEDCYRIWSIAIRKAWADATDRPVKGFDCVAPSHQDQEAARKWLITPSLDLAIACAGVGRDPYSLLIEVQERALSNWQIQ